MQKTLATGTSTNNILYTFDFEVHSNISSVLAVSLNSTSKTAKAELLQRKFSHLLYKNLKILFQNLRIPNNAI